MTMLRYNAGKVPLSLVPSTFFEAIFNRSIEYGVPVPTKLIWQVGQVLEFGAQKYSAHNWRKGGQWSSVLNSAMRHLLQMVDGRRIDPESNLPEAGHLGCNIAFLLEFVWNETGEDDRFHTQFAPPLDEIPEPSLMWVAQKLLEFRDGGTIDDLKEAAWELARWVEMQSEDEPAPAAPPAPATDLLLRDPPAASARFPLPFSFRFLH